MRNLGSQRGLGLFGLIFVLAIIGSIAYLLIVCVPVYLNEGSIQRDLHDVATKASTSGSEVDPNDIKLDIQRRWDVDYISNLDPKDIKVVRSSRGATITYDYEVRKALFYNLFLVMHFHNDIPITGKPSVG